MNKEQLWLQRLKDYKEKNNEEGVCSWWLRLAYENDEFPATTSQINYYLDKSVKKWILRKESTKSYTKYYLL
ncbi:hypothetical protein [Elizabethkingia anophelis]|uniref:Uncharacterized protein n=1 Tax=Elizabethkingia anophelis TaxID=1117645 RepID=A0AAU8UQR7_9FLAO|nr:hypothetical protein [Elizabethkingia anophelis]AQX00459.1 hypothetical protein BBD32_02750 [Elizabethkingia anophelis]OPB66227.1 hypothetical protein BAY11_14780 [Elizabethkingia anophelis]